MGSTTGCSRGSSRVGCCTSVWTLPVAIDLGKKGVSPFLVSFCFGPCQNGLRLGSGCARWWGAFPFISPFLLFARAPFSLSSCCVARWTLILKCCLFRNPEQTPFCETLGLTQFCSVFFSIVSAFCLQATFPYFFNGFVCLVKQGFSAVWKMGLLNGISSMFFWGSIIFSYSLLKFFFLFHYLNITCSFDPLEDIVKKWVKFVMSKSVLNEFEVL